MPLFLATQSGEGQLKIAQVCIRYLAPGGAETHIQRISEELVKRGHEVTVYTTALKTEIPWQYFDRWESESYANGVKVIRFPIRQHVLPYIHFPTIPGLIKAIYNSDVDVVHAHSHRYYQIFACASAKFKRGKKNGRYQMPLVVTPHFHPPSNHNSSVQKFLMNFEDVVFSRRMYRVVDKILIVTDREKQFIKGFVPISKCVTVPNGIDIKDWTPIPDGSKFRNWCKLNGEDKVILYTGRLADNKGLNYLIDASSAVVNEHPEAKFVIVGEDWGILKELKKKIWANNLDDYFIFTGHIDDYDLFKSAYSAADVFVLPSEWEAFGIVLLEAMACSTPVVASNVGGVPCVVGDAGRIFEYGDVGALAKNIIEVLHNTESERAKSITGRKRVMDNFTWDKVVDALENVYYSLVDE